MAAREVIHFPFRAQLVAPAQFLTRFSISYFPTSLLRLSEFQQSIPEGPRGWPNGFSHAHSWNLCRQSMQRPHMFAPFATIAFVAALCCMKY
jgi:hypothetical protein